MNRCDFSSVIKIIQEHISAGNFLNQIDLVYNIFEHFINENIDFDFDYGQTCRWINGAAPVSPRIAKFYLDDKNSEYLSRNINTNIIPLFYDTAMTEMDLYSLVISDMSISEQKRAELTHGYPYNDKAYIADFFGRVIIFAINRKFEKRSNKTLTTSGMLSPITTDVIFDGALPKQCKYFCGRDSEISKLHELLSDMNKIFISGIAGIGKSEFVKAYANIYKKDYTNILYFNYTESLQNMITDMDFADDMSDDDNAARFKKHNRFLRSLKEDTLIIIDNFNTSASKEPLLDVVLKYNCKVIFTTRSKFESAYTYKLKEISDINILADFAGKFYSDIENNRDTVIKIIEAVHSHTLSVELSARLLQKGMLEPNELLERLSENGANPETADKIGVTKDGINIKATYYNHIHTLFELYTLDDEMQGIMRCMTYIPNCGIRAKMLAKWLELSDMNAINDLIETGFIQNILADKISLAPMINDITIEDLKPSVSNCKTMLSSIQQICLRHGEDISYSKILFETIEKIISRAQNDDTEFYIRFIEDAFSYMEKYKYENGMRLIVSEMERFKADLQPNDLALLYDFQSAVEAMFGTSLKKAIELSKKAVAACVPEENFHLAANLNMNLGYYYHMNGDLENAKFFMEKGMKFMSEHNELNNDIIIMLHNYSNLMSDCDEPPKAVRAMKKCAGMIKENHTDMCSDYSDLYFDIGVIYLQIGENRKAEDSFKEAFRVYKNIYGEEDSSYIEKHDEMIEYMKKTNLNYMQILGGK